MKENGKPWTLLLFLFSLSTISGNTIEIFPALLYSIIALRKAEKEEEQRARERIRQKLEEDKVRNSNLSWNFVSSSISCVLDGTCQFTNV